MPLTPLLLIGAGGHARSLLALLRRHGGFTPVGLIDPFQPPGTPAHGFTILGGEADVPALVVRHGLSDLLVAVGDNAQRQALSRRLAQQLPEARFPVLVDPTAIVAHDASLAAGAVVMAGAHVGAGVVVGEGCLLNTLSSIDHDGAMEPFSSLAPGAILGANVRIGRCSSVGLGARIIHRVAVGDDTVVGAGSLVLADLPAGVVAYGSPARVVRTRRSDEPYL